MMQAPNPLESFLSHRSQNFFSTRTLGVSALLAALLALSATAAHALDLTVEVTGIRSNKGEVLAGLFVDTESWLKKPLRGERVVAGERVLLVFRDLPAGRYALTVFHDENSNGKLDSNLMGMPIEPLGFSRDAKGNMGPAKFDDAALLLDADTTVKVTLQ
jgi:uncharacterized protein (DUF2141 family)